MANVVVGLVVLLAVAHVGFLVLEMFLWTKPFGMKTFRMTPAFAAESAKLAANQGLYNGFLAAGLVVGLCHSDPSVGRAFQTFFLVAVSLAGIYGGLTVKKSIIVVQALPALIALGLMQMAA